MCGVYAMTDDRYFFAFNPQTLRRCSYDSMRKQNSEAQFEIDLSVRVPEHHFFAEHSPQRAPENHILLVHVHEHAVIFISKPPRISVEPKGVPYTQPQSLPARGWSALGRFAERIYAHILRKLV